MFDIFHTVSGLGLNDGGPSRSVPALADAQASFGHRVTVIDTSYDANCENGIPEVAKFLGIESLGIFSRKLDRIMSVQTQAGRQPIIHDHGLWLRPNFSVWRTARRLKAIRLVSPRGMLSTWALQRNKRAKSLVWRLWQEKALREATAFHATSQEEALEIRRLGFTQPIAVVPNGITFPTSLPSRQKKARKTALFLSRIHPKKGLLNLIQAWHDVCPGPEWELVIAGPDEGGHVAEVNALIKKLRLTESVSFSGELDDVLKWQAYVDADIFVLPSMSENFGIVIAEAMAAGTPVITTTATPWKCLKEQSLGWWVPPDVAGLTLALEESLSLDQATLNEMGQAASKYAREQYDWTMAAESLLRFCLNLE